MGRRVLLERAGRVHRLAVRDPASQQVVASADLIVRGSDAELDAVATHPDHRGAGLGNALVREAVRRAAVAGADLVLLTADADDWPREWYARRGFAAVGPAHSFTRRPSGAVPGTRRVQRS